MNASDMLGAAIAGQPMTPAIERKAAAPTHVRYFIACPINIRTGQALPGRIPLVYTREDMGYRPVQSPAIVNGLGWSNIAEISSADWLRVTLAQKAHDDAQGDGGAPAALVPEVPMLPPGGSSVDPAPVAAPAPRTRKLSGIAARAAAGMVRP